MFGIGFAGGHKRRRVQIIEEPFTRRLPLMLVNIVNFYEGGRKGNRVLCATFGSIMKQT